MISVVAQKSLIGKISNDVDLFTNRKPFLKYDLFRSLVYMLELVLMCTELKSFHFYRWLVVGDPFFIQLFAWLLYA